jgi:acyl carrier protein
MKRENIINKLNEIFENVIDEGPVFLTESSTSDTVDGWDSLAHIQLIVAIEKTYNIRFTSDEMSTWKNVGEMIDCILAK